MSGIVVVAAPNDADQGAWQYSTNGTDWFAIGAVSTTTGLALSASTHLRFAPAKDWNGTPGPLTVHLTDSAYADGFSSGATRAVQANTSANGVSSNTVNLGTTVASVNDLPYFTSAVAAPRSPKPVFMTARWGQAKLRWPPVLSPAPLQARMWKTAPRFSSAFAAAPAPAPSPRAGFFGTLTLDTGTKAWTYTQQLRCHQRAGRGASRQGHL